MLHIIMTQYALKTGLSKFKEQGEAAVTKELTQLHILETFTPVDAIKLTKKQISEDVASLMLLKVKSNG